MDARTGKTLWRTTWPLRAYNLQTHKHRGTFGVPLVAGGKVLYPSFSNSLQAIDAKTGKALWGFGNTKATANQQALAEGAAESVAALMGGTSLERQRHNLRSCRGYRQSRLGKQD